VRDQRQLFDFMQDRVNDVSAESGLKPPQAFGKWFAETYFLNPQKYFCSDGSGDGKVDSFFEVSDGDEVRHYVLNTKFTKKYESSAPVSFYDEITRFWQAFANKANRQSYLSVVRPELRQRYQKLFTLYEGGRAQLFFVTNHRRNENQYESVKATGVQIIHLHELLQFVADYIEDAMPLTPKLTLTGISTVLSADKRDTNVPTSIVFAKLVDVIRYMRDEDPYDLLFARNIRLKLQNSKVNPDIAATFRDEPADFVFSNNGITMLCEGHSHDPGTQEVRIENPRVVNGSQTLHSIRDVSNPSTSARVMVRIIQVRPPSPADFSNEAAKRREIIEKISIRSNLQNPIKKWNLISNDDYQHSLARYFRKNKLYYERRDGEWAQRRTELKSVGIRRGPNIRELMQLIASYH
jgi:AIPR protein